MGPRGRERRSGAVQSTNDSSALSKSSLAAHGRMPARGKS
uniref:Leucine carboxyl methyltransferase 2 n=2 Tax=Canis lupus familiaris TaxID=9615 RepID=A0A8C0Z0H5_CANLF